MIDWHGQLFSYCERALNPAFWAEPWNAISNGAFWIAALVALYFWCAAKRSERHWIDLVLIALIATIGLGSFLFHTFATRWAVLADVFPIIAFMLVYLGVALKRFFGWGWIATLIGVAVFFVSLQQAETIRCGDGPCLNGSVGYLPALAVLIVVGAALYWERHPAAPTLLLAGAVFAVSLTLRTIDKSHCHLTDVGLTEGPLGVHFLWHLLNAVVLFLLVLADIRHGRFTASVLRGTSTP